MGRTSQPIELASMAIPAVGVLPAGGGEARGSTVLAVHATGRAKILGFRVSTQTTFEIVRGLMTGSDWLDSLRQMGPHVPD